jgi:hypothetical protein
VAVSGVVELSHTLPCVLDVYLHDPQGESLGQVQQSFTLAASRSPIRVEVPLHSQRAGYHTMLYTLTATPPGVAMSVPEHNQQRDDRQRDDEVQHQQLDTLQPL